MESPGASGKLIRPAAWLFVAGLLTYLSWHSIQSQIDYFDSFSILKTAKGLADGHMIDYNWRKAPLLSIVLAPFFSLENLLSVDGLAHLCGRLFSILCFAGIIYLTYRLITLFLDYRYGLAGALLLAVNPMFIHHAPFSKDDLPGTALAGFAVYLYARHYQDFKLKMALACALATGFALTARYNFLPTLTLFFAAGEAVHWFCYRPATFQTIKRCVVFVCLPLVVFLGLHMALYYHLNVASFAQIPVKLYQNLSRAYELTASGEPAMKNYVFLAKTLSWPVLGLFIAGFLSAMAAKEKKYIPLGLWFLVYFIFHTYFVDHKEARYLMPIFPAIYVFVAAGLHRLLEAIKPLRLAPVSVALILSFFMVWPLKNALTEGARFHDPFFRVDFEKQVSRYADALAAGRNVIWVGPLYPLVPREYIFDINDDFWNMFHFSAHIVYFYTNKDVVPVRGQPLSLQGSPYIFVPLILQFAGDGDVLIINREDENYMISTLPARLKPLYVQKVRVLKFVRSSDPHEFRLSQPEDGASPPLLWFETAEGLPQLGATGLADGAYELYFQTEGEPQAAHINFVFVKDGRFKIQMTDSRPRDNIKEIILLTYGDHAIFPHPTYPAAID